MDKFSKRILIVIPVLLFIVTLLLADAQGPYFYGNNMEDYAYLLNSVNLLTFQMPAHTDHPGTTLQVFGAIVIFVRWLPSLLFGPWESIQKAVLGRPEDYLHAINLAIAALLAGTALLAGRSLCKRSGSLAAALILQGGCFFFSQALLATIRVQNEPLLIVTGFLLSIPLADYIFRGKSQEGGGSHPLLNAREAVLSGGILALGVISKITFTPFALMVLFFKTMRERVLFCVAAVVGCALLLLPVYWQLGRIAGWVWSLIVHKGRYGQGAVGVLSTNEFRSNLVWLFHSEPLLFLLLPYYGLVIVATSWDRRANSPVSVIALKRLLMISMAGIIAVLGITAKHPAAHYLVPGVVFCIIANSAVALLLKFGDSIYNLRRALIVCGVVLGCWGLYSAGTRLLLWMHIYRNYRSDIAAIQLRLREMKGCTPIGFYRSSLPTFALFFGNSFANDAQGAALAEVYPDAINLNIYSGEVRRFSGRVEVSAIRHAVASGSCYVMQGTRNIDKQYLKPMVGLGLEPIYEGSNEGLYRLKLEGEVKPLIGDAVLPRGSVSLEAEAFTSGTVERDSRNFGRDIGVITSPRYPAYAEYSVNVAPGKYELRLRFASGESRPLTVRLNGEVVSTTGATDSTGGWGPQNQMWQPVALVEMRGSNVIRLESASPFPHVDKLGLVPAGALPKVH